MITFNCPGCGKNYKVGDDRAGKRTRCPKCGQKIRVPKGGQLITPRMKALEPSNRGLAPPRVRDSKVVLAAAQSSDEYCPSLQKSETFRTRPRTKGSSFGTFTLVGGIAAGLLLLAPCVCAIAIIGYQIENTAVDASKEDKGPTEFELGSFDDIPPPVLDAAQSGKEVWELREWETGSVPLALHISGYIVLDSKGLKQAFWKEHHSKGSIFGAKNREVIKWGESKLDDVKEIEIPDLNGIEEKQKLESHWSFDRPSEDRFTIAITSTMESETAFSTHMVRTSVVIDKESGQGYWKGEVTTRVRFRGRLADSPDREESRELKGSSVVPVKGKK